MTRTDGDRERFTLLFDAFAPRVFGYARRSCDVATAQDVVSDTFLVAWRRLPDIPDHALPWLLVVARNTIANRRRGAIRHDRLAVTLGRLEHLAGPGDGADHTVVERATFLAALAELTEREREAILLVAWDGLAGAEAAAVAGCSRRAFEVRLSRARARLTRAMAEPAPHAGDRHQIPSLER